MPEREREREGGALSECSIWDGRDILLFLFVPHTGPACMSLTSTQYVCIEYVYNLSRLVLLLVIIRLSPSHVTRKKKVFHGSNHEKEVSSASSSFSEPGLWSLTAYFLLLGLASICVPISGCAPASLPCNMTLAVCSVSCHCLCSAGLWQSVLPYKVVWQLQPPVEMKVWSLLKVALKRPLSEQSIFLLSRISCKDAGSASWNIGMGRACCWKAA